jgi:hypothetical protein
MPDWIKNKMSVSYLKKQINYFDPFSFYNRVRISDYSKAFLPHLIYFFSKKEHKLKWIYG